MAVSVLAPPPIALVGAPGVSGASGPDSNCTCQDKFWVQTGLAASIHEQLVCSWCMSSGVKSAEDQFEQDEVCALLSSVCDVEDVNDC